MDEFDKYLLALTENQKEHYHIITQIYELAKKGNRDAKIFLMPIRSRLELYKKEETKCTEKEEEN